MPPRPETIALQLDLDTRAAEKATKKFEGVVTSSTRRTEKVFEDSQKSQFQAVSKFFASVTHGRKIVEKLEKQQKAAAKLYVRTLKETGDQYRKVQGDIKKTERALRDLMIAERDGHVSNTTQHKKDLEKQKQKLKGLEEQREAIEKLRRTRGDAVDKLRGAQKQAKEKFGLKPEELINAAAEAGAEMAEPLTALLERDWPRALKSGGKLLGTGLDLAIKGAGKGLTKVLKKPAAGLMSVGGRLQARGQAMGGMTGKGVEKMGGALSGLGSFAKGVGPLLQSVAKLGPILGALGGAVAGLVKLFLDADAMVKDFNRDVLASSSSVNYLHRNLGNAGVAAKEMEADLKSMRDQAFSLDSIMQGLGKEDFTAVINTLATEGVALHTVATQFGEARKAGEGYAKVFSNNVQMAVAYSRTMGVSLQEVAGFQAELMTEMGTSVGGVVDSFQSMSRVAYDAGIAQNKFFGMIRSVSSDLSLYNTRLDDTVHLLGALGKIMSPRNAQKFMQFAMQAMKGMDRVGRLKLNLLTGGKLGGMVDKDLARKSKGVSEEIGRLGGAKGLSQKDIMTGSIDEMLKGVAKEQQGALKESILMMRQDAKMNKKGVFGQGLAARNLSPGASVDAMMTAMKRFGKERGDLGFEMAAQNLLGLDEETTARMTMMADAIDEQRKTLAAQLAKGGQESVDALEAIRKAGIDAKTVEEAQGKLAGMSYDELMATMDKSGQNQIKEMGGLRDFAKEQADNTTSLLTKIERFFDWFTNQFYNLIQNIYEAIMSIPGVAKAGVKEDMAFSKSARDIKDADVQAALGKAGSAGAGNLAVATRDNLIGSEGMKLIQKGLRDQVAPDRVGYQAQTRWTMLKQLDTPDKLMKSAEAAGIGGDQLDKIKQALAGVEPGQKIDPAALLEKAGLSEDTLTSMAEKSAWFMDPATLATIFPALKGMSQAALGGATPTAEAPSAQTQAAAKTEGAPVPAAGQPAAAPAPAAPAPAPPELVVPAAMTAGATEVVAKQAEVQSAQQEKVVGSLAEVEKILRQKGIVLDKTQWKSRVQDQMDKGTLDAIRTALYEYYLYKDLSQEDVQGAIRSGIKPEELGPRIAEQFGKGMNVSDAVHSLQKNAVGGTVTGISGGVAQVRPASGEGLASIGRGERIVPAGGAAPQVIELRLSDELARIIDARASDVYARNVTLSKMR